MLLILLSKKTTSSTNLLARSRSSTSLTIVISIFANLNKEKRQRRSERCQFCGQRFRLKQNVVTEFDPEKQLQCCMVALHFYRFGWELISQTETTNGTADGFSRRKKQKKALKIYDLEAAGDAFGLGVSRTTDISDAVFFAYNDNETSRQAPPMYKTSLFLFIRNICNDGEAGSSTFDSWSKEGVGGRIQENQLLPF